MSELTDGLPQEIPSRDAKRPSLLPLVVWFALLPIAAAYGGWKGDNFGGWGDFASAVIFGVLGTMVSVAISWFQSPVFAANGSYSLQSLFTIVAGFGGAGGLAVGLILWLAADLAGMTANVVIASFPESWNGELPRACIGGTLGGVLAVYSVWQVRKFR